MKSLKYLVCIAFHPATESLLDAKEIQDRIESAVKTALVLKTTGSLPSVAVIQDEAPERTPEDFYPALKKRLPQPCADHLAISNSDEYPKCCDCGWNIPEGIDDHENSGDERPEYHFTDFMRKEATR